ncbi:hypothetical protein AGMMS50239_16800 [Bacteroidia bacterium]|nr:hypothetical protein AGMMS50239_16800 [Bacteroidia bacterium]
MKITDLPNELKNSIKDHLICSILKAEKDWDSFSEDEDSLTVCLLKELKNIFAHNKIRAKSTANLNTSSRFIPENSTNPPQL